MSAMMHTAGDELSNKFADFSAGWLKGGADDAQSFKANKIKSRKRLTSVKNETPIANRNISSIVSRIRDEGSAFSNSDAKMDKHKIDEQTRQNFSSQSVKKTSPEKTMAFAEACDEDIVSLSSRFNKADQVSSSEQGKTAQKNMRSSFSVVCDQPVEMEENIEAVVKENSAKNKSRKKQLTLIFIFGLSVMLVFAYMSYHFKLQSDEMKQTLLMYKQAMNEEHSNQIEQPVVAVAVKDKASSLIAPVIPEVASEQKNVSDMTINVISPINEEENVVVVKKADINTELALVVEDKKIVPSIKAPINNTVVIKPLAIKKAVVKTYIAADKPVMFTVNLASFSEKNKAYGQLATFKSLGVSPIVERTMVGNKTIYRLCVEGFASREEAGWFISRLNKKHAINAWVRQG